MPCQGPCQRAREGVADEALGRRGGRFVREAERVGEALDAERLADSQRSRRGVVREPPAPGVVEVLRDRPSEAVCVKSGIRLREVAGVARPTAVAVWALA